MAKTTLTATLPNGEIAKRTTERTYTHAVCFDTKALSWCGSFALAQKRIAAISCPKVRAMLQIVPVNA
ncbi:MAG: hypothetical protein EBY30_00130 [Rhodospirillales bacterium]|nr:hypothetical protein [Rhodospirillales bacterium]